MPAWRWPGTGQKKVYLPGFSVAVTFDVAPWFTVGPVWLTPLPSIATPCGTADGLSIVIVTLPAFALSDDLSNLRAPLGSAESLRLPLEAPAPELLLGWVLVVAGAAVVDVVLLLLLLLPHPATARAAASARASGTRYDF